MLDKFSQTTPSHVVVHAQHKTAGIIQSFDGFTQFCKYECTTSNYDPCSFRRKYMKCNPDLCSTELHLAAVEAPSTNGYDFGLTYKFLKVKDG